MEQWQLKKACLESNWKEFLRELYKTPKVNDDIVETCVFFGKLRYLEKIFEHGSTCNLEYVPLAFQRKHWNIIKYFVTHLKLYQSVFASACQNARNFAYENKNDRIDHLNNCKDIIKLSSTFLTYLDNDTFADLCYIEDLDLLNHVLQNDINFTPKLKYSWPVNDFLYNNKNFCTQIVRTIPIIDLKKIAYQSRFLQCPIEEYLEGNELYKFVKWRISHISLTLASCFPAYVVEHIISYCLDTSSIPFHERMKIVIKICNKRNEC